MANPVGESDSAPNFQKAGEPFKVRPLFHLEAEMFEEKLGRPFSIRLDPTTKKILNQLAMHEERSKNAIIRCALREYAQAHTPPASKASQVVADRQTLVASTLWPTDYTGGCNVKR
jgi:hypothetical protein